MCENIVKMSDSELEISTRAYCKILMHAAKYPSSNINGLLLSKVERTIIDDLLSRHFKVGGGKQPVKYVDCIPMLHINTGLAPMAEVALAQVQADDQHVL